MKIFLALFLSGVVQLAAQTLQPTLVHQDPAQAGRNESEAHHADVERHGNEGMGFPQNKTTHHFRLYRDGGAIDVSANDIHDERNTQAVRDHLKDIAAMFSNGNFSIPMFVHDRVPPGVPVMKAKRKDISYAYQEIPAGARVQIKTSSPETLKAVHEFLRFQIEDHHTGDPTTVSSVQSISMPFK